MLRQLPHENCSTKAGRRSRGAATWSWTHCLLEFLGTLLILLGVFATAIAVNPDVTRDRLVFGAALTIVTVALLAGFGIVLRRRADTSHE